MGQLIYVLCWVFLPMGFFPVALLAITGGMGFGLVHGMILTFIGAALNLSLMFITARYLFRTSIHKWLSRKYPQFFEWIEDERKVKSFLIFARIVPLIPYTVENYLFGLTNIKFWEYLYLSLVFILPGTFIYVNIGDKSMDLTSPAFIVAIVLLVVISVVPILVQGQREKRKRKHEK